VNYREVTALKKAVGKFSVKDDNTRNVMKRIFFFLQDLRLLLTGPKVQSAERNMTNPQAVTCQGSSSAKRNPLVCLCGSHTSHKFVSLPGAQ